MVQNEDKSGFHIAREEKPKDIPKIFDDSAKNNRFRSFPTRDRLR